MGTLDIIVLIVITLIVVFLMMFTLIKMELGKSLRGIAGWLIGD